MELIYRSTRNANETATASEAILKGLANEGGLFEADVYRFYRRRVKALYQFSI